MRTPTKKLWRFMKSDQKLKVGLVFDDSLDSNDGVAQYVKTLGRWLSDQGHTVSYIVGETKMKSWAGGGVYSLSKNLKVQFNGNSLSVPLLASRTSISNALADKDPDVLHIMMPHSPLMAQRVINRASNRTAVIGTFHVFPASWSARYGGKLLRLSYGRGLGRFNSFVSVSAAAQSYAKKSFGIESEIIPNPVRVSSFSSSNTKPEPNKIVFLGRLVKRKGCEQLIEAFSLLSAKIPDARLVIAGDGQQRQYLELKAKKLNIGANVKFLGFIDESNKPDLLASASVACFPSLYGESFGIVLIEAMAAGSRTVLGGDNPGYRTVLGDQPELLVDPTNKQKFAEQLEKLLTDKRLVEKLHEWQINSLEQYDIQTVGERIVNLYRSSIASQAKNSHNDAHGIQKSNS
ncbi:glycosyltransferase family 4 protein [Candidatus Saccharibacteria bacterium]|nr:glycosyltransferase family 4 protein [Candidatus Saccharibacteria bacterium]